MKKRLLITSIVMMLVVAVALSTATYAWFTSNANVTASTVTMTASTNQAPSIGIAWTNTTYGTEISATSPSGTFDPMIPSALSAGTTAITAATAAGGVDFYSATIKDDPAKFNDDVKHWGAELPANQVAPYVWTNGTQTSFFLKNLSDTYAMQHVVVKATIDGKGADLIRVAVFARIGTTANTASESSFVLKKVLSNVYTYTEATEYVAETTYYTAAQDGTTVDIANATAFTTYTTKDTPETTDDVKVYTRSDAAAAASTAYATDGSFAANNLVSSKVSANTTDNAVSIDLGELGANCIAELIVYVWTDGTALVDNRGGQAASIKLDVSASRT